MNTRFAVAGWAVLFLSAAAAPGSGSTVRIFPDRSRDAYALVLGDTWRSGNQSIEEMNRIRVRIGSDGLWFRRRGKVYVMKDRAKLEEANALFREMDSLEPDQRSLEERQRLLDKKEEAIDRERDDMEDSDDDAEERRDRDPSREMKLHALEASQRELQSESRRLDEEERELDRRSEAMERAAEAKLWTLIDGWISDGSARLASER